MNRFGGGEGEMIQDEASDQKSWNERKERIRSENPNMTNSYELSIGDQVRHQVR